MAISQSTLREAYHRSTENFSSVSAFVTDSFVSQTKIYKKAFLCHSHHDEELAKGLEKILRKEGITLYIDWDDSTMPEKPNKTTAKKIQDHIKNSDYFLFLMTEKAKESRWCPWEIGFADACKKNIIIIPTKNAYGNVYGNEYLELYDQLDETTAFEKSVNASKSTFIIRKTTGEAINVNNYLQRLYG